ncbi:GIY-YIG nuclease family protein [soil metagenome]
MNFYYVYILRCEDNSYYTGITNNLERRLQEHIHGLDPKAYTFFRRPVELVYRELFNDPEQAIAWEKQIKGWNRKKKEAIIAGEWDILPELAACKNSTRIAPKKPE